MVTGRRTWIVAAAVVVLAGAPIGAVLALRGSTSQAAPRQAVMAKASLSRSGALFADPLTASIEVLVDRERVDPARLGFSTSFEPYVRVGIPRVSRHDAGRLTRLVYTTDIVCSADVCLPPGGSTRIQFPSAEVFYFPKSGVGRQTLTLRWQPLTLAGRTTDADIKNGDPFQQPSWHASTDPLAVSYRVSPFVLKSVLFVASAVLFALAALAFSGFLRALGGRLRLPVASALERAVKLVERTEARDDAPAKRKALELLSRELARSGESQLALAARELAWAEPTPVPAATEPLTLDVRRLIEERSNGHAA